MKTFNITIVDSVNGSRVYRIQTWYDVADAIRIATSAITSLGNIISISTSQL